ncbi:MAG TPA: acyl carrier protein [Steroidobacteraceae bacterium]|nr:acyl carrier protein [Steroidobacteraceae bacterium]
MSLREDEIYAELQQILNRVMRRQDIRLTPELSGADIPGWDSFRYVSLIVGAEKCFKIRLDDEEVDALNNFGELARTIQLRILARDSRT